MNKEQAAKLKNGEFVTDGTSVYQLLESGNGNPHDLWFWKCNKSTRKVSTAHGGSVKRVYLGSKNLEPSGLEFLESLILLQVSNHG